MLPSGLTADVSCVTTAQLKGSLPIVDRGTCSHMGRLITVNDRMQRDYRYERVEPVGRNFDPEFKPDLTPAEMLGLGVFGGKYMTDCGDEFPTSWFEHAKLATGSRDSSLASTHTMEVDSFVPRDAIDQRFLDTPYYVTPNEPAGHEAFAVIREATRHKAMMAVGRLVLSKRERVIALAPYDKGLLGTTLRYPYEVRDAKNYFGDLPDLAIAPDKLTLAAHILDSKAGAFEPATFRDRYEEALLAHLKARQAGAVNEPRPALAAPHRVINLMEALRRSIAEDKKQPAASRKAAVVPAHKRA
jgi:non-homologous end joining protein Ku